MTAASWGPLDQVGEESGEVVAVALVVVVDVVDGVVVDVVVVVCTTVVVVVGAKVISAVPSPSQAPATSAVVTKRSRAPPQTQLALPSVGGRS